MTFIKTLLMGIGAICVMSFFLSLAVHFRDRSGNSGRYRHWEDEE